jgi:uncharacterized small protein (DUF1192 family)
MALDTDEIAPPPGRAPDLVQAVDLDRLSVHELEARVLALKAEIVRVEAKIAAKQASQSAADAFFRPR